MTAIPQSGSISNRLTAPLRQVAQRQWYVLAVVGIFKTLIVGLLALLAAALLLGAFANPWAPARIVVAAAAWVVCVWAAARFLRPALARWSLSRAAMQIEKQQPGIQERLSSAVELAGEKDPIFRGSPGLVAHLMRQAEADAAAVKPQQVVRPDRAVYWGMGFLPVLIAWLLLAVIPSTSSTTMAGLYRVLMPWRGALPAMLTQVSVTPGDVVLVQGDPIDITAHVTFPTGSVNHSARATLVRLYDNGQKLTDAMESAGSSRDFRLHFDDLQESFSYMVSTSEGDSQWFKATVHPRPQINDVDIRCDYPAYTKMASTIVSSRDGTIEALVGTRVTVTVHTALPVVAEKSQIVIDQGTPEQLILPLTQLAPGKPDYQAQLIVNHSGEYKINLTNEFDLTNKDEQPRSIVAQPDEAPTIVIQSPEAQVAVRPDDTVPVRYLATDDFGVSRIDAIVQVDDHAPKTVAVAFKTTDPRTVQGPPFVISVADVLKGENLASADHITYQLKVTDDRDPDPQFTFSDKQTLKINKYEPESFQAKEDRKIAADLTHAIEKAIAQLNKEQQEVQPARDVDPRQPLQAYHRKLLHEATQSLPKTSHDLAKAADAAKNTVFQDVAKQVKKIADTPIRAAAEDSAQADLNADNGQDRKEAAERSVAEITKARDALQKLLEKQEISKDQQAAEAARDLAEAAQKQQEAARLMKPQPQAAAQPQDAQAQHEQKLQQAQAVQKQAQADQKLRAALDQSEALRDPQAQATAQKLQDLIRKVEDTEKQQQANAEQTEKQQAANQIQQKANELAKQQEALNQQIHQNEDQHKDALQKASANPPSADQQNNIVKNLNKNNLPQAHQDMKQAATQLHQAAQQLANQAKSNDLKPTPQQQDAVNKDQQAAQQAQNQQNQAQQVANALKQEAQQAKAAPKPDDAAVQNAKHQAQEIAKEAGELHPQDADAQHDAQAAQQDAQAAQQAADQAAQDAKPQDAQAANPQDAQAAKQAAQAQQAAAADAKKHLADAAHDLDKAAAELADAAKKNADAHKGEMVKAQQQEAQAAADQTEQQAQAQDALAQQAEAEQNQLAQVQQNQQQPDQTQQQENQVSAQAQAAQQQADQLQQQADAAKNPNVAHRAQAAKAALAEARHHAADAAKAQQQAADAQHHAADATNADQAKAADQQADQALAQAADQQQQAQDALAKAEGALRNLPDANAQADAQQPQTGQPDQADAAQQQDRQEAAQAAQEAAQAQQEAGQQNADAAQQAANALHQAAQAMARATPGLNPDDAQPDPGQEPGEDPSQDPSQQAGKTPDSKQGISQASAPISLPASVRDIGITADQWAKLPPLARKDLLNAAHQSGPPSYRQMIKEYYVRVAKMEQAGAAIAQ